MTVVVYLVFAAVWAAVVGYLGDRRGRSAAQWAALGLIGGLISLIVLLVLPDLSGGQAAERTSRDGSADDEEPAGDEMLADDEEPDDATGSSLPPSPTLPRRTDWTEWSYRVALILLFALIFIPFMGSFGLWDPWETHYGEVGRQLLERGDWVSTWWGSHWRDGTGQSEGSYFFSKPILLMWMMGLGLEVFGFNAWGIRFLVGIIAIFSALMVYVMGRQIWTRRTGTLLAIAVATSPFFSMLGRQAQTDMPFVGLMTVGMCFFMMAQFGRHREEPAALLDYVLLFGFYLLIFVPQMQLLAVKFPSYNRELPFFPAVARWGVVQVVAYSAMVVVVLATFLITSKRRTKRQIYMLAFYLFVALASLAKGILGFALPGAIILTYLLVSREWRMLLKVELPRGALLFVTVAFPWYVAMILRHGREYVQRFFVHDHLKRLASGVHQTDNGSFEHFIKWLGYGLFPWVAFVPAAFARLGSGKTVGRRTDAQRARLVLVLWVLVGFALFTLANTKFHHYIFPCVPALAMLAGLFLADLLDGRVKNFWPLYLAGVAVFVLVGYDLILSPESLKNLFTYQYGRMWSDEGLTPGFTFALQIIFAIGLVGLLLLIFRRKWVRVAALSVFITSATSLTVWALDYYMPRLAVDWSQGYLWDTYYSLCTRIRGPQNAHRLKRYCAEPAIAYRLNWRGETFYTQNEVIPIEDNSDLRHFLEENGDRSFYAIMQQSGRLSSFRSALPSRLQAGLEEVHTENEKFILVRVLTPEDRAAREAGQDDESAEVDR